MDSATFSGVRPNLFNKGPEQMNSKRSCTEETSARFVGNTEYDGPSLLQSLLAAVLHVELSRIHEHPLPVEWIHKYEED